MPYEHTCPKCGSEYREKEGYDGRKFTECSSPTCTFNYTNLSKPVLGKKRTHFKLTKEDYVQIQEESDDYTIGFLARRWGVSRKQIKKILRLNLSTYAEEIYGEQPIGTNVSS